MALRNTVLFRSIVGKTVNGTKLLFGWHKGWTLGFLPCTIKKMSGVRIIMQEVPLCVQMQGLHSGW